MFTSEQLESTWKEVSEFEHTHFGLKFGPEFPSIASVLRSNKQFLNLVLIANILSSMEMSGLSKELKEIPEGQHKEHIDKIMGRPGLIHATFAELFYLGYRMGRTDGETCQLEKLSALTADR